MQGAIESRDRIYDELVGLSLKLGPEVAAVMALAMLDAAARAYRTIATTNPLNESEMVEILGDLAPNRAALVASISN